jgi:hypothetical protein
MHGLQDLPCLDVTAVLQYRWYLAEFVFVVIPGNYENKAR